MYEITLSVSCSGEEHRVRVHIKSWEEWQVVDTTCFQKLGETLGKMTECYRTAKKRGVALRQEAIEQLAQQGAVDILHQALRDPETDIRARACEALRHIGTQEAAKALLTALKDPAPYVRVLACAGLGWCKDPSTAPELAEATRDPVPRVRAYACDALGSIGVASPEVVEALKDALHDKDREVGYAAYFALKEIGVEHETTPKGGFLARLKEMMKKCTKSK